MTRQASRARPTSRSAIATTSICGDVGTCARNIEANFPAPISATRMGPDRSRRRSNSSGSNGAILKIPQVSFPNPSQTIAGHIASRNKCTFSIQIPQRCYAIIFAALAPIIMLAALVLPLISFGMIEASATPRFSGRTTAASTLDQTHTGARILTQSVGDDASGRTCSNHDEVERLLPHHPDLWFFGHRPEPVNPTVRVWRPLRSSAADVLPWTGIIRRLRSGHQAPGDRAHPAPHPRCRTHRPA